MRFTNDEVRRAAADTTSNLQDLDMVVSMDVLAALHADGRIAHSDSMECMQHTDSLQNIELYEVGKYTPYLTQEPIRVVLDANADAGTAYIWNRETNYAVPILEVDAQFSEEFVDYLSMYGVTTYRALLGKAS